ncbi:uncharacterized protein FIBRA_01180 [Fibroporia radiculosa]|uniref:Protein-lysine N-methyltransferase EFM6 n=1 Tax=Fibroporia radiculosa TaxID=599839 RepID=J4GJH9_9APHY|nr:uncharacterized protein FIBRA_01180 [Fibroporia radiculosa]CCL99165.1 predicted protein [Fibroporia radiculosa]
MSTIRSPRHQSVAAMDLVLEEELDEADPLRHLRAADDIGPDISDIVPAQPPSIINQTIELSFATTTSADVHCADSTEHVVIKLAVDASPGCGGIAWPAGEVLSQYIARRGSLQGKTVLELGSGTGLVGLVAGILGASVWITDQEQLLDIMSRNVSMNDLDPSVHVAELNWSASPPLDILLSDRGDPIPRDIISVASRLDLILLADCVYFEPAFPLLVRTLADLVPIRGSHAEVLFCYKKRRKADKRFFTLLKKEFTWLELPIHLMVDRLSGLCVYALVDEKKAIVYLDQKGAEQKKVKDEPVEDALDMAPPTAIQSTDGDARALTNKWKNPIVETKKDLQFIMSL